MKLAIFSASDIVICPSAASVEEEEELRLLLSDMSGARRGRSHAPRRDDEVAGSHVIEPHPRARDRLLMNTSLISDKLFYLSEECFEFDNSQSGSDGTFAHALERCFGLLSSKNRMVNLIANGESVKHSVKSKIPYSLNFSTS